MHFLGAPWPRYYEAALKNDIEVIRLPMLEGSCPHSIEEVDVVVDLVIEKMARGENVLTHCRGGKQSLRFMPAYLSNFASTKHLFLKIRRW